jgi:neutral ceramidase
MKVGSSQIDITPEPACGRELSGFVARVQPALGVHDPLFVRGLFVSHADRRLLWLHADLVGLERAAVVELKKKTRERFGLDSREIVVSATHTHSGPATIDLLNCGEYDTPYVEWLQERMLGAARAAMDSVEEADAVFAEGRCDLAIDRRGRPSAHTDPRLGVVAWRRADGSFAAVLANYAVHHVALGHANRLISADMAGHAAREIAAGLPGQPVVLFTNGGAGNLNPPKVGTDFAQMEEWARQLARAALTALSAPAPLPREMLAVASRVIAIPLVRLTEAEIRQVAARYRASVAATTDYGKTGYDKTDHVSQRCRDAVDRWECHMNERRRGAAPDATEPMEIQVVSLGGVVFACFGAEMFSITAEDLRPATGRTVYLVGYANGLLGYLPPAAAYDEGGYEVDGAHVFYDQLPIARGAYELARDAAVDLIRGLG